MEKSIVAKVPGSATAANEGDFVQGEVKTQHEHVDGTHRKLEDNAYVQNKYNSYKDGSDDAFIFNEFGFDSTTYSASYSRCASMKQFDDEIAATEDTETVFVTKHFAVFRFCPEQTCMGWQEDYAKCGCEQQCETVMQNIENYYQDHDDDANNDNGDDQEELCLSSCYESCRIWGQQVDMTNGNSNSNNNRKLEQEGDMYNWNRYDNNPFNNYEFDPYWSQNKEVWGANGEGCQANYGEYMIELKDYLELMMEWQESRFEMYEEYCETCMDNVYQQYMNEWGRKLENPLTFEEFKNSDEHRKLGYYGACPEFDTCQYYLKIDYVDEYSQWFECTEVERNNQVAYVGPHCAEDGFEITLGVYSDEDCNEYIGNGVDVQNWIGEEMEEDALRTYYNSAYGPTLEQLQYVNEDQVCIPCNQADLMWDTVVANNFNDDAYGNANQQYNYDQDSEVNELCTNLYMASARCDKHFRAYSNNNNGLSKAEYSQAKAEEDQTCEFIDNVVMGNFNEMGFVNIGDGSGEDGWVAKNIYSNKYGQHVTEVSPLQIFGIVASLLAVAILGVWSVSLHKSLTKRGPWQPRRGLNNGVEHASVERQSSGIMMGRSTSNASYYVR